MTVIARAFDSVPARSALETWDAILNVIAPDGPARDELDSVSGIACSLITREAMRSAPIIVTGGGPRLRVYCIYGEDAITGDDSNESKLTFSLTGDDWSMSLPCPEEDLNWVQAALLRKSTRVTARDVNEKFETDNNKKSAASGGQVSVNTEAFFRS